MNVLLLSYNSQIHKRVLMRFSFPTAGLDSIIFLTHLRLPVMVTPRYFHSYRLLTVAFTASVSASAGPDWEFESRTEQEQYTLEETEIVLHQMLNIHGSSLHTKERTPVRPREPDTKVKLMSFPVSCLFLLRQYEADGSLCKL